MPEPKNTPTKLKPDDLVEHVVPDPAQVPNVIVLVGLLGRSNRAGYWRIYFTPAMNEYVEFREEDVVHSQSLATEQSPLGGTIVWVSRDADLLHTRTVSRQAQVEFLQGDILSAFLAGESLGRTFAGRAAGVIARMPHDPTIAYGKTCIQCYTIEFGTCPTKGGENTCIPALCF